MVRNQLANSSLELDRTHHANLESAACHADRSRCRGPWPAKKLPTGQQHAALLASHRLHMFCVETRHMKAALAAQINKSDRNDARGIAQMMRVGLSRPVHAV